MESSMPRKKKKANHSTAFVVGSLLGGFVAAVATLWKTPQSGSDLRAKISSTIGSGGGTKSLEFGTAPASGAVRGTHNRPPGEARGEPPATGIGHIATTEELTKPPNT